MALREKLLTDGAAKNSVAWGLAGVGTPEAMALREKLLTDGAAKNSVAWGLAGVGTPEAMALREKLLTDGADKNSVAEGLAGVNSEESFAFREQFLDENPTIGAQSFQTGWSVTNGVICRYGYETGTPEAKPGITAEAKLEGPVAEQIEAAIEKLGRENVFGPKEVEKTFGVRLAEIPDIPFSIEELERAEKMGQMLVLRVDKTVEGKPMSLEAMGDILVGTEENPGKWRKEGKGGLLSTDEGWRGRVTGAEDFAKIAPRSGWALVSKDLLPDSTSKNYIEQTEVIIKALEESAFKDLEMPEEYAEAIKEFNEQKERLTKLMSEDWAAAAKELSELKINQLTRQSIQETVYDLAMHHDTHGKRLLPNSYTWSNSRSSRGGLVNLGDFDASGVSGRRWDPVLHAGSLGVSLSRRL